MGHAKREKVMRTLVIKTMLVLGSLFALLIMQPGMAIAQRGGVFNPEVLRECLDRAFERLVAAPFSDGGGYARDVANCVAPVPGFPPPFL
jgi:hypothetical protein